MHKKNFFKNLLSKKQTKCPCCKKNKSNSTFIKELINLPKYPITEFYRKRKEKFVKEALVNQKVLYCKQCDHMFLENILDIDKIYNNTITTSHSSRGAILCLENFFLFIKKNTKNIKNYNLVDIGGNDSTFLEFFKGHKKDRLNLDANAHSQDKTIKNKKVFLEKFDFRTIKSSVSTAYLSSHTLEHLENPFKLLEKLSNNLKKSDVIYLQFPSLEKLIEHKKFDQICHQHINYFSLKSINLILRKLGLYILKYEYDTSHFGTVRLKISNNRKMKAHLKTEKNLYKKTLDSYNQFLSYYKNLQKNLTENFVNGQGFGAGLMVPILAYYLPIINRLDYLVDENKFKIGKKFINLKPEIKNIKFININKPVLITSISTKEAGRNIFNKLTKIGVRDICIPSIIV